MKSIISHILLILIAATGIQLIASSPVNAYKKNSEGHNAAYKQLVESRELLKEARQIILRDERIKMQSTPPNYTQILNAISKAKILFIETAQNLKKQYATNNNKEIAPIINHYQQAITTLEQLQVNLSQIKQNTSQQTIEKVYQNANFQIEKICSQVNLAKAKLYIFQKSFSFASTKN